MQLGTVPTESVTTVTHTLPLYKRKYLRLRSELEAIIDIVLRLEIEHFLFNCSGSHHTDFDL